MADFPSMPHTIPARCLRAAAAAIRRPETRHPAALLAIVLLTSSCGDDAAHQAASAPAIAEPTFSEHIAPIIYENCSGCHRPGESGPFPLITYRDVRKHASDIVTVTHDRYMPPWLPKRGPVRMVGERGLSDAEIETIARWKKQGSREGDPGNLPRMPVWPRGWQLDEPDLAVTLDSPYTLPAEGTDVFRNFVFDIPVESERFVRAVELRPGNPAVVHHATMKLDQNDSCRRLDAADPEPGFPGMEGGYAVPPKGYFLGWSPGKSPARLPPGMAWRLEPGRAFVLQLHMRPSGKPEVIQPSVGFHLADEPPAVRPYSLFLDAKNIDIPAGKSDYVVEESFIVPVEVSLTSMYPHAHYICRSMHITARLPGGEVISLLEIPEWDFDWQDVYTLAEPLELPRETVLTMRYVYDNSSANLDNPHDPPQRIVEGNRTEDEMGNIWIQLVPRHPEEYETLNESALIQSIAKGGIWSDYYRLGNIRQREQRHEEAVALYREGLTLRPNSPMLHHNLGASLGVLYRVDEAVVAIQKSIELEPNYALAHVNFGILMTEKGDLARAVRHYRRALELDPGNAQAQSNLADVLRRLGED